MKGEVNSSVDIVSTHAASLDSGLLSGVLCSLNMGYSVMNMVRSGGRNQGLNGAADSAPYFTFDNAGENKGPRIGVPDAG